MSNGFIRTLVGVSILLANVILAPADVHAKKPSPMFPPIDPSRVDCTAFRTGNEEQCYETANEVFQLASLILSQFAANEVAAAEQDTLPTTPQLSPDGTVLRGIDPDVLPTIAAWIGSNNFAFVSTDDTFMYRPLDKDLVILFGGLSFTIVDYEHGGQVRPSTTPKPRCSAGTRRCRGDGNWCTSRSGILRHCLAISRARWLPSRDGRGANTP